jgi:hypothetical protein
VRCAHKVKFSPTTNGVRFGVGAAVPKEIENGTFTRRVPGSDDKLLQQLIGKKRAKAHLDAKHAKKNGATQLGQKPVKPQAPPKKEESEDEEEGRASAFKSKKRTITKSKPVALNDVATDDGTVDDQPAAIATPNASKGNDVQSEGDESDVDVRPKKVPKFGSQKSKPVSYLDQLLAEKSKKKKNKTKAKLEA